MDKKKKSKVTEITLLSIFGAIWVLGFILAVLGIVAYNLPYLTINNPLYSAQKAFAKFLHIGGVVDFRIFGSLLLLVAMIFIIIVLYHYANKYDAINAKKARREERRKNLLKEIEEQQTTKIEEKKQL